MTKANVLQKLDTIRGEVERILNLLDNDAPATQIADAQKLLRALKANLQAEYIRMATTIGEASLSDVEANFYRPAVEDAWANTTISSVRWNSRPDESWRDALYDVDDYMTYWRRNLQK